jgi:long-chain fatty acid transport protein
MRNFAPRSFAVRNFFASLFLWEGPFFATSVWNKRQPNKKLKITKQSPIGGAMIALCLISALANPRSLPALGIRLPDQDAFATARGNAFAATADDPAAVYYNPAGITQLQGANLSLGMYGIELSSRYSGPAGSVNSQQQWAALPQGFSTISFTNYHLALGLGIYSPYGLSMSWPNKAPWAPLGKGGEIDYVRANPVVAYQPWSTLSIAAGAMIDYSQAELETSTPGIDLHGRDTDAGFNLGVLWHPWEQHSFGATYRSATDMNYQGHVTFLGLPFHSQAATLNYHLPQTLAFGYSYRPTEKWNFEVDVDWTDWTSLRTANIVSGPVPAGGLAFNWKPSTMYEFGATRYFGSGWQASAGYMYSENSVPSGYFTAAVPDSDRHLFSLGIGKKYQQLSWNVAYQLGYGPSRTITGDIPYNGSYEFFSNALSFNIGYHF